MIEINGPIASSADEQAKLTAIAQKNLKPWASKAATATTFRERLMREGLLLQSNRCAWCSLTIGESARRSVHRDHIAPKGKYKQWSYVPMNLVLSCDFCNSGIKAASDTVAQIGNDYKSTTFRIVHPYLDRPIASHIRYDSQIDGVLIKGVSKIGEATIQTLHLDTPELTVNRAADTWIRNKIAALSPQDASLLLEASAGIK